MRYSILIKTTLLNSFFILLMSPTVNANNEDTLLNTLLRIEQKVDSLSERIDALEGEKTAETPPKPAETKSHSPELEQVIERLDKIEEQNQAVKTLQMSLDTEEGQNEILKLRQKMQKAHAIQTYKWVTIENWDKLEMKQSVKEVIEILGEPYKIEPSLHKRIDDVYFYQTDINGDGKDTVGKVKFYKGKLVRIEKPEL